MEYLYSILKQYQLHHLKEIMEVLGKAFMVLFFNHHRINDNYIEVNLLYELVNVAICYLICKYIYMQHFWLDPNYFRMNLLHIVVDNYLFLYNLVQVLLLLH